MVVFSKNGTTSFCFWSCFFFRNYGDISGIVGIWQARADFLGPNCGNLLEVDTSAKSRKHGGRLGTTLRLVPAPEPHPCAASQRTHPLLYCTSPLLNVICSIRDTLGLGVVRAKACIVMAYIDMAYIVMAYIVTA